MHSFKTKIDEVKVHFKSNDIDLGYRKMLDCVLDIDQVEYFKKVVEIENWVENNPNSDPKPKYSELLKEISKLSPAISESSQKLIEVKNLSKSYGKQRFSLSNINLEVNSGEIIGLVGENGNGKTTLLRILAKELSYDNGSIDFNINQDLVSDYDLRTKLTYIPQRTPKWYGSLQNNLKYCASTYGLRGEYNHYYVMMMIIRFGLWRFRDFKWSELSSGYKMRFELARTFLRAPEILFLDEPLANLDIVAQQLILEDLKNMARSISHPLGIVLSSQQLFEVEKIADYVIFLKNGQPYSTQEGKEDVKKSNLIEIEIENEKADLESALEGLEINEIHYNGGMYTIDFTTKHKSEQILSALLKKKIQIHYFRNITNSTKRLFVK